jgi:predicted dithiol-disulfide oxidoreductase (DUF899 family)
MSQSLHSIRFPNESDEYRAARNALLEEEIALRRQVEAVAAKRRALPPGGEASDYEFEEQKEGPLGPISTVRLADLFSPGRDTLVLYSYMYGPEMDSPCPLCTSILDALDGSAPHIVQRANFAVVARNPIEKVTAFAVERGWRNLRLLTSAGNTYNRDYRGEDEAGDQSSAINVFIRRDGKIHHFYNSELFFVDPDPGQDPRAVDSFWPIWNIFDLTPEGRGDWHPSLSYGEDAPAHHHHH